MPTFEEAFAEAAASAPASVVFHYVLEMRHPSFLEGASEISLFFVANENDSVTVTIEPDDDRNPGAPVECLPVPFVASAPAYGENVIPESSITIDNIGREATKYLEEGVSYRADLVVILRQYRSDDLTAPCYGPVRFVIRSVKVKGATVTGVAKMPNLLDRLLHQRRYTPDVFKGLAS